MDTSFDQWQAVQDFSAQVKHQGDEQAAAAALTVAGYAAGALLGRAIDKAFRNIKVSRKA